MSKGICAALVCLGLGVTMTAPAQAAFDNGPISSHYERDGRKAAHKTTARHRPAARRAAQNGSYRKKHASNRGASAGRGRAGRLASRSVTHRGNGGGASASRSCLQASAAALLARVEAQFGPVNVISTCRPGARIAGSGKPSKHGFGLAVDFDAGSRKGAIVNWLRANHHAGGTMTYAGMSHIHIDIGPHFVSLGSGGGRRRG
jgi:hypothetical protein